MSENSSEKKKGIPLIKIVFLSSFVAAIFAVYLHYFNVNKEKNTALKPAEISTGNEDIFEVSEEYKNHAYDLSDLTINEMRERGAEFIYQMLLKNQLQLENVKADVELLKRELTKYKNREKIGRLILSYVALRDKFFAGLPYQQEMRSFAVLTLGSEELKTLQESLKELLPNLKSEKQLSAEFSALIPQLIAIKNHGDGDDFIAKLRRNFSQIITIRKVDVNKAEALQTGDAEIVINKVEKLLAEKKYSEALSALDSLELKYQTTIQGMKADLQNRIMLEKTDQEILNYFKQIN